MKVDDREHSRYAGPQSWAVRGEHDAAFAAGAADGQHSYYRRGVSGEPAPGYGYGDYYRSGDRQRAYPPHDGFRDAAAMHRSYGRYSGDFGEGVSWYGAEEKMSGHRSASASASASSWYGNPSDVAYGSRENSMSIGAAQDIADNYYRGRAVDDRYGPSARSSVYRAPAVDVSAMPYSSRMPYASSSLVQPRPSSYFGSRADEKYGMGGEGFYRSSSGGGSIEAVRDYAVGRVDDARSRGAYSYYGKEPGAAFGDSAEPYSSYSYYRRFSATPYYSGSLGGASASNSSRYSALQSSMKVGGKGGFGRYAKNFKSKALAAAGSKRAGKGSLLHRSPTKSKKKDNSSGKIQKVEHKKLTTIEGA